MAGGCSCRRCCSAAVGVCVSSRRRPDGVTAGEQPATGVCEHDDGPELDPTRCASTDSISTLEASASPARKAPEAKGAEPRRPCLPLRAAASIPNDDGASRDRGAAAADEALAGAFGNEYGASPPSPSPSPLRPAGSNSAVAAAPAAALGAGLHRELLSHSRAACACGSRRRRIERTRSSARRRRPSICLRVWWEDVALACRRVVGRASGRGGRARSGPAKHTRAACAQSGPLAQASTGAKDSATLSTCAKFPRRGPQRLSGSLTGRFARSLARAAATAAMISAQVEPAEIPASTYSEPFEKNSQSCISSVSGFIRFSSSSSASSSSSSSHTGSRGSSSPPNARPEAHRMAVSVVKRCLVENVVPCAHEHTCTRAHE